MGKQKKTNNINSLKLNRTNIEFISRIRTCHFSRLLLRSAAPIIRHKKNQNISPFSLIIGDFLGRSETRGKFKKKNTNTYRINTNKIIPNYSFLNWNIRYCLQHNYTFLFIQEKKKYL